MTENEKMIQLCEEAGIEYELVEIDGKQEVTVSVDGVRKIGQWVGTPHSIRTANDMADAAESAWGQK